MAKRTQKAIAGAFAELLAETPMDKITVLDICEKSGVSRSTFYYHYHDISALLEHLLKSDIEKLMASNLTLDSWVDAVSRAIMLAEVNRKAILNVYAGVRHDILETYLFDVARTVVGRLVEAESARLGNVDEADVRAVVNMLSATFVGLLVDWLLRGLEQGLLDDLSAIGIMMDGFIKDSFDKLAAKRA